MLNRVIPLTRLVWPVVGASGAKALLQVVIAAAILSNSTPENAIALFQLFFLQATCIALISAAGYMRGFATGESPDLIADLLASRLFLAVLVVALVVPFHSALPGGEDLIMEKVLLAIGAVATGLTAPLQGHLARTRGNLAGFGPSLLFSVLATILTVAISWQSTPWAIAYLTLSQVGTLSLMLWRAKRIVRATAARLPSIATMDFVASNLVVFFVGAANVAGMLFTFFIREYWSAIVPKEAAATIFFMLRIADSVLGTATLLMVRLDLRKHIATLRGPLGYIALLIALLIALTSIHAAYYVVAMPFSIAIAQLVVELVRYPSSAAYIVQSSNPRSLRYLTFIILPQLIGAAIVFVTGWIDSTLGLQSFLVSVSLAALAINTLQRPSTGTI